MRKYIGLLLLIVLAVSGGLIWWYYHPRVVKAIAEFPYYQSVQELTQATDAIVIGEVRQTQVRRAGVGVETISTVAVQQVIRGEGLPQEVIMSQLGGKMGFVLYREANTKPFRKGERVLLFLRKLDLTHYGSVNPTEGELRISSTDAVQLLGREYPVDRLVQEIAAVPN